MRLAHTANERGQTNQTDVIYYLQRRIFGEDDIPQGEHRVELKLSTYIAHVQISGVPQTAQGSRATCACLPKSSRIQRIKKTCGNTSRLCR